MGVLSLPYPYPDPATGQWDAYALLQNLKFLAANIDRRSPSPSSSGTASSVHNLVGKASASATTLSLTMDLVTARQPSTGRVVVASNQTLTLDLSTQGAGGRDQAAAFNTAWVHVYAISQGSTFTTVASATAPPTGPTLPSGYVYWAYLTTLRVGGTNNQWLRNSYVRGAMVHWAQLGFVSTDATAWTSADASTVVPPNAVSYRVGGVFNILPAGGTALGQVSIAPENNSGSITVAALNADGLAGTIAYGGHMAPRDVPNVSQTLWHSISLTTGTLAANALQIFGYGWTVANGDA